MVGLLTFLFALGLVICVGWRWWLIISLLFVFIVGSIVAGYIASKGLLAPWHGLVGCSIAFAGWAIGIFLLVQIGKRLLDNEKEGHRDFPIR